MADYHGEFKVPGGKLVVADLAADDGVITWASINGDFFLEPDEALADINEALVGLSTHAPNTAISQAVAEAVGPSAVMFGFDADSVAVAVRRALGHATTWADHDWEVIPPSTLTITENVALDEVLTREVGEGRRNPTLRLWDWDERSVVIGTFQSYRNEVDPEGVEKHGVTVVRRISGGGAMFMEAGNCVTYSLYLPTSLVDGLSFAESYPFLDAWVMEALAKVGVSAFYKPLNDIATEAGKIGGAAQKRLGNGAMLHHVTMSYDIDAAKMTEVLRIGREKISDKGIASAQKRVDPLKRQTGMDRADLFEAMMGTFEARYGARRVALSEDSLADARALAEHKFATRAWLHRVP
ncbi:biotin/lipoate A/B protein ligase family protein [Sinomonas atrocyanea]|uniref:lipoate--protein ligase family protein n=1 Tax=Sinomonas atrocyanea TaxID=37927 RepID=UPI00278B39AA|nr:biotin/lipoate A/B protein ligase family protein [Sinomonas atrocyanea]MDQ0259870.1 lipoate-protein ligase A [Sinomonas atrocyanea]MDR6619891.1 lipoate-protein ligase A [Sinomonas atrocyanea]